MDCPSCGQALPGEEPRFCPFCGFKLEPRPEETKAAEVDSEAKTQFDMSPLEGEPADTQEETTAIPDDELPPTVLNMPSITEEEIATVMARSDDLPAPEVAPGAGAPGADGEFSETAWFMSAVSPEQLLESEGEALDYTEQDLMTERYHKEETLPDEVRKDFSLSESIHPDDKRRKKKKKKKK